MASSKLDKMLRRDLRRSRFGSSRSSKDRIERILREDVFDVGDEQFLMLLLVMKAEGQDRLDFREQRVVGLFNQFDHAVDRSIRESDRFPPPSAAKSGRADRADACRRRRCSRN